MAAAFPAKSRRQLMDAQLLYEIVVTPEGGSTGQNLIAVIDRLDVAQRFPHVAVLDVECNENRTWAQSPPFFTTTQEVLKYARSVGQFDWASFFFFAPDCAPAPNEWRFATLFAKADLTIRAVDDTYFYVYSPLAEDVSLLSKVFAVHSSRKLIHAIVHPT
jgi:hypothetical protein